MTKARVVHKCEDYMRSVHAFVHPCSHNAKYVFTNKMGKKKYLCGKHKKMYPENLISNL